MYRPGVAASLSIEWTWTDSNPQTFAVQKRCSTIGATSPCEIVRLQYIIGKTSCQVYAIVYILHDVMCE